MKWYYFIGVVVYIIYCIIKILKKYYIYSQNKMV